VAKARPSRIQFGRPCGQIRPVTLVLDLETLIGVEKVHVNGIIGFAFHGYMFHIDLGWAKEAGNVFCSKVPSQSWTLN
jgi:hypothetical protein